jgi:hypothetical protein
MIGMKAKLVPCTMGSRAPTGPRPMVWNSVAMPAKSIDIWISRASRESPGEFEPKPKPAAPRR